MNIDPDLTPLMKNNSKWIVALHVKCKTLILLEDITEENLGDLGLGNDLLQSTLKARSIKENTDKLDFIRIKNHCFAKDTVKRMKISI